MLINLSFKEILKNIIFVLSLDVALEKKKKLYPMQRVAEAEGMMFLTRLSVSQSLHQSCFFCKRNSSETAQQNFMKLCNYEGHDV